MKISFVELKNFRKLKCCRIDFSNRETIFVGANNSGKTSAMDALILFLKEKSNFKTQDFTLSNWESIDKIGQSWLERKKDEDVDYKIIKYTNKGKLFLNSDNDKIDISKALGAIDSKIINSNDSRFRFWIARLMNANNKKKEATDLFENIINQYI